MGGVSREKDVLKLVRPGGIVEIHNNPITAAQVMERYPRHCVTRPDVFKYPWIVVRPESVLSLGHVFYVVPRYTIRRLLQSNGLVKGNHNTTCNETLSDQAKESVVNNVDANDYDEDLVKQARQPVIEPSAFHKLARESPPNEAVSQTHNHRHKGRLNPKFPDGSLFQETIPSNQNNDPVLKRQHHSKKKQHSYEHSLMMIEYKTDKHKVRPTLQAIRSIVEERRPCQLKEYDSDNDVQGCFLVRRNVGALEPKKCNLKLTTNSKPCLKKNKTKNNNMQLGPRVTFNVPEDDHDEKLGIKVADS